VFTYDGRSSISHVAGEDARASRARNGCLDEPSSSRHVDPAEIAPVSRPSGYAFVRAVRGRVGSPSEADLQWRVEHLLAYFAATPLDQITISDIDAFRLSRVQEGVLGAASINKMITTLAGILETAVEYELIACNPAKGRKRRLPVVVTRRSWLDRADHITALLDGAGEVDQEGRAVVGLRRPVIATFAFAGLRLGELQALRWRDVDLDRGTISVRAAKTDAGIRLIDMLPILRRELSAYRDRLNPDPDRPVFATATGKGIGSSNIRLRVLARAVTRANANLEARGQQPLPAGLTPHSLRRTFASLLFALGGPPPYVMGQMGHTTPGFTLALYAREMSRRDGERQRLQALVAGEADQPAATTRSSSTATTGVRSISIQGPTRNRTSSMAQPIAVWIC
jgi:integrase